MPSVAFMSSPLPFSDNMDERWKGKFPIMDFYLQTCGEARIGGCLTEELHLIDIGKPETLEKAASFLAELNQE